MKRTVVKAYVLINNIIIVNCYLNSRLSIGCKVKGFVAQVPHTLPKIVLRLCVSFQNTGRCTNQLYNLLVPKKSSKLTVNYIF